MKTIILALILISHSAILRCGENKQSFVLVDFTGGIFPAGDNDLDAIHNKAVLIINTKSHLRFFDVDSVHFLDKTSKVRYKGRKLRSYERLRLERYGVGITNQKTMIFKDQLTAFRAIRNYCYALHGKVFSNDSINHDLKEQDWYVQNTEYEDTLLDQVDWIEINQSQKEESQIVGAGNEIKRVLRKWEELLNAEKSYNVLRMDSSNFLIDKFSIWMEEETIKEFLGQPRIFETIIDDHYMEDNVHVYYYDSIKVSSFRNEIISVTTTGSQFLTPNKIRVGMSSVELLQLLEPKDMAIPRDCILRIRCNRKTGCHSFFYLLINENRVTMMMLLS